MRLPANRREWLESLCRTAALLLIGFAAYRALAPLPKSRSRIDVDNGTGDLVRDTRESAVSNIHFALNKIPSREERSWIDALRAAGSNVSWSGTVTPILISGTAVAAPQSFHTVRIVSPDKTAIDLRDDMSPIDTISASPAFIAVGMHSGNVRAVAGSDSAFAALSDSALVRPVLVLGKAGWETKFVLAALEEAGWKCEAMISVAPGVLVDQGSAATIDTSRYSAVVALDESAGARVAQIASFVRTGGGLVLGEAAARTAPFSELRTSVSAPSNPRSVVSSDTVSRQSSSFVPLSLKPDAVTIEQHGVGVSVAGRRVGFGRVVQVAYSDTWRWRLQGGSTAIEDHRNWWSGIVSQAARAERRSSEAVDDRAPYVDLVAVAGQPTTRRQTDSPLDHESYQLLLALLIFSLLATEWASRRLRGVS